MKGGAEGGEGELLTDGRRAVWPEEHDADVEGRARLRGTENVQTFTHLCNVHPHSHSHSNGSEWLGKEEGKREGGEPEPEPKPRPKKLNPWPQDSSPEGTARASHP